MLCSLRVAFLRRLVVEQQDRAPSSGEEVLQREDLPTVAKGSSASRRISDRLSKTTRAGFIAST